MPLHENTIIELEKASFPVWLWQGCENNRVVWPMFSHIS